MYVGYSCIGFSQTVKYSDALFIFSLSNISLSCLLFPKLQTIKLFTYVLLYEHAYLFATVILMIKGTRKPLKRLI